MRSQKAAEVTSQEGLVQYLYIKLHLSLSEKASFYGETSVTRHMLQEVGISKMFLSAWLPWWFDSNVLLEDVTLGATEVSTRPLALICWRFFLGVSFFSRPEQRRCEIRNVWSCLGHVYAVVSYHPGWRAVATNKDVRILIPSSLFTYDMSRSSCMFPNTWCVRSPNYCSF